MDRMKNIQLQAMRAIISPNDAALYRYVCRWYSSKFATPLLDVYDIPTDFVLQQYFEDLFENMSKKERYDRTIELIETQEERQERLRLEEAEITEQVARVRGLVKDEPKKLEEEVKDRQPTALEQQIQDIFGKLKKTIKMVPQGMPKVQESELDEETRDALSSDSQDEEPPVKTGAGVASTPSTTAPVPTQELDNPLPEYEDLSFSYSEDELDAEADPFSAPKPKPPK